jgi:hypothetical protein
MYRYLLETEFGGPFDLEAAASVRRLHTRSVRTGHRRMVDTGYASGVKITARKGIATGRRLP